MAEKKIASGLHIVATPIGTADDITLHALRILRQADVLAAEDTRVLRKLMDIHGIELGARKIYPYHDHNGDAQRPKLLNALSDGKTVAYASDAGTPLIADPGFSLSKAVVDAGFPLHAAPGASAILTALCLAGQPTDKFYFGGFLSAKKGQRVSALRNVSGLEATLVFYESPKRLASCLEDMKVAFGADRPISVCRELTKKFEEVIRGDIETVLDEVNSRESLKGEVVVVLGPPIKIQATDEEINNALSIALQEYRIKDAAAQIAEQFDIPRKRAYELALKLKGK